MRLTEDSFEKYQTGKVVSIAADGVEQAVQKAWLGVFELFEKVVFLVVMMGYSYYVSNSQPYLVLIPLGQTSSESIGGRPDRAASWSVGSAPAK